MDAVTLENYRCFRRPQTARLAPLTLLVGENSTGKTSFLALVRALWDVAFQDSVPDFRAEPYDMGAFADVVHSRGGRSGRPDSFDAGFVFDGEEVHFQVTFAERDGFPFPTKRRFGPFGISSGYWFLDVHGR